MKRLLVLVAVLAVLGGIAWGIAAMTMQTAAQRWLEARAAEGWVAHSRDLAVGGFPSTFETTFAGLELADPDTGWAWSAPEFRLEQQVLRLDQLVAVLPPDHSLASPEQRLTFTGAEARAMLDVQPTNRFALDQLGGTIGPVLITSTAGWDMGLERAHLNITRLPETSSTYDLEAIATALVPPDGWRARLDPVGVLPVTIDQGEVRATVQFDSPWNIDAIEQTRPQITQIDIDELSAMWGNVLFRAVGVLDVTPDGYPEGDLSVRAENWRIMVDLAENSGALPARLRPATEAMLEVLAGLSGSVENIDATLSFSGGRVFLGPLPIGPAPNLTLR